VTRNRLATRLPPWLVDVGPVALIVLAGGLGIALGTHRPGRAGLLGVALALIAITLLMRRRAPFLALAVVLATSAIADYGPISVLPALIALLTVVMRTDRRRALAAGVLTAIVIVATPAIHGGPLTTLQEYLSHLVPVGLAVAVGFYLRARSDYIDGLRERAERLERERELLSRQAVGDERVRIARELHDVVAHHVSLMVVQAQALGATGDLGAEQQSSLTRIAGLGREAMSEMHRMLGVLRLEDGTDAEREPQPGVHDLDALVARSRDAGIEASLEVRGEPRALPPGVETSAYRIVQEALTNVIRHAHARHAAVTVTYGADDLELIVADDGVGANGSGQSNGSVEGHGLIGMRERVALFGGQLEAGAVPTGRGYRVRASLPTVS
jgi:signal transduction histidine kinase